MRCSVDANMDYFAYGSNMWSAQMQQRCPDAEHGHVARVSDHRFVINSRGVATIVEASGHVVHGVVWRLGPDDVAALDHYEGVADRRYVRSTIGVNSADADRDPGHALIYLATDSVPGPPRPGYLEKVLAGGRAFGLPSHYLAELAGWARL